MGQAALAIAADADPSLSEKQKFSIKNSNSRLNIWHGPVRSGKTVGSIYRFIEYCGRGPKGDLLLSGKTVDALKRNVITPLQELLGHDCIYQAGKREIHIWDRTIHVVGASDERSEQKIRGGTFAGALGDELTLWPESYFKMMLSRLSVPGAMFFGSTNPDNPNHWLKTGYINREHELDLTTFHWGIDDNPFLDPVYVANLKKEYIGLWYKRFILGEWCVAEGAVYDFFDEKLHTIQGNLPNADYYDVGVDYGTTNPTVFILFGNQRMGKPKIWAEREHYYDPRVQGFHRKTDTEHADDFVKFIYPYWQKIRKVYYDPSAASFIVQLRQTLKEAKIRVALEEGQTDVTQGIRTVARMLHTGEYKIVERYCPNIIKEKYSYCWDPKKQAIGLDEPLKQHDHAMDPERYVIYTKFGDITYDITKFTKAA